MCRAACFQPSCHGNLGCLLALAVEPSEFFFSDDADLLTLKKNK